MKIYLAGAISDKDAKEGQIETVRKLRQRGVEDIYAAALNNSINDKSNNPTPIDIYNGDIDRIKESDVFIVRLRGSGEEGTISEIGMVAGWNEMIEKYNRKINKSGEALLLGSLGIRRKKPIKIIAYTTNERVMQPQFYKGIPSGKLNHLVLGMIDRWGVFAGDEEDMFDYIENMMKQISS